MGENLPPGRHLSLSHWESPYRSRRNENTSTRQIILVPHSRISSILCDCYALNHFPIWCSRCQWTLLNWIAKSEFVSSFDIWPSHQCIHQVAVPRWFRSISLGNSSFPCWDCIRTESFKILVFELLPRERSVRSLFIRANGIVGTLATLCSSIANISAVFALKGHEAAFVTQSRISFADMIDLSRMLHSRRCFLRRRPSL